MRIVDVSAYQELDAVATGAREKVWISDARGISYLYKAPKNGMPEAVAECLAYEIARALGLRHAVTELAVKNGVIGSISRSVLFGNESMELIE